jgi:NAD(P)-dependent dehydrogenase (short-subunit alcohol dehydrogenase family)
VRAGNFETGVDHMTDVALVTGGTGGIGRAICARLSGAGYAVLAGDVGVNDPPEAVSPAAAGDVLDYPMDVRSDESVEAAVQAATRLGKLTGVVNCAGVLREARAEVMPQAEAEAMWAVNVMGAGRVTRAALPHLGAGAAVVNISSIVGAIGRFAGTAMYSASKAGLEGLTRVLACELASRQVRVNAVAPGFIRVPMAPSWASMSGGEEVLIGQVPLGRLGEVDEVADVVEFLLSDRSSYVTGSVIRVDGGVWAW